MTSNDVPSNGFEVLQRSSPLLDLLGPVYGRREGDKLAIGLLGANKHCNGRGFIHGGVLCTLADIALGYNAVLAAKDSMGMVTTSLAIDYAGSANPGDWIEVEVDVQKAGRTLAFANCYFWARGKRIARASAVFCRPTTPGPK